MSIRQVVQKGAPVLGQKAKPIKTFGTPELSELIDDLRDTLKAAKGVGIAAPQIGVSLRVIVVGFDDIGGRPDRQPIPVQAILNPSYEVIDPIFEKDWEGCLSISGVRGLVPRYKTIRCAGYDVDGKPMIFEARGYHARIIQHECDHLDGKLFDELVVEGSLQTEISA